MNFVKDILLVIREGLVIATMILALVKGPGLVNEQKSLTTKKKNEVSEKLRSHYITQLGKLSESISIQDKHLQRAGWKGSPSWEQAKAIRDLNQKELERIEKALSSNSFNTSQR